MKKAVMLAFVLFYWPNVNTLAVGRLGSIILKAYCVKNCKEFLRFRR